MGIINKDGSLYMATGIDNSGLYSGLNQAEGRIDQFGNHISAMGDKITRLTGIGFGIAGLKAFGDKIVDVRGEMQLLETSFAVLLGNETKANKMLSEIKEYNIQSPLSLNGISQAAQLLLGFNVEAEKVMPTLKQLGDISMGDTGRFQSLALAFAQMSAAGKLMGQDLLQMINAGFNPLQEISKNTGKSLIELRKEMENGAISSEMVANAFASATAQGGKFYGMTEKQAEGIKGLQAKLEGGLIDAFNQIGKSQEGLIAGGYKVSIALIENYQAVGEALTALIATYGLYKAAMVFDTGLKKAIDTVKYTEEAKALEELASKNKNLISQEQIAAVSKSGLIKGSKEYADALKNEIELAMERSSQFQLSLQNELTSTRSSIKAKEESIETLRQEIIGRETSLQGLKGMTDAENALAVQKELTNLKSKEALAQDVALLAGKEKYAAKAELIASIEAEADEKTLGKLREKVKAADDVFEIKTKEWKLAQSNVSALEAEIEAGNKAIVVQKGKSAQTKINNAEKQLNTKYTQLNTLEQERNSLKRVESTAAAKLSSEGMRANSLQTQYNTAVQNANTASTNILTAAKTKLITVAKNLWAALAPNPYVLAAAAVVALAYGIYKLATAATAAEQAQSALNKQSEETARKADNEKAAIERLMGVIKDEVSTRNDKQKALDALQTKYPSIFSSLDAEKIKNLDLADAIRQVNIELEKRAGIESKANIERAKEILSMDNFGSWGGDKEIADAEKILGIDGIWDRYTMTSTKLKNMLEEYVSRAENKLLSDAVSASKANFNILPKNEKISSLKKDVDNLQNQYNRLKKLDEEQKNNPFSGGLSLYAVQLEAVESQINAKNAQIKTIEKDTEKTVLKNKAYWEKIRDDQQKVMDSNLPDSNIFKLAQSQRDEAAKKLEQWNKTNFKSQESAAEKAQKLAQKKADDQLKLNNDKVKADLDARNIELDNQQSLLNIQEDGFDKQQKQADLNHQKEILAIDKRAQDLIEKKQDAERKEWDIKNPNGSKTPFKPKTKSVADLDYSDITSIIESDIIATKTREKAISDSLKATIEEYQSYVDKYAGINTKFNKKIADLEKARTPENKEQVDRSITEAKYEQGEALKAVNNEFAQREETFLSWTNQIADLSLKQLQNLLSQVEKELKAAESSGVSGADLAVARAKVDAAKEQIKNANTTTTPGKRTIKEWQDLEKTLHDVNDSFEEIGDSVGGTVGVILSAAGQIASSTLSMINGIITLANSASTATEQTAKAASASIQAVEKASVILAIISAALQIATKIASLFAADYSEYNKAKEAYESYISVLDKVIEKQKELVETMTGENARNSYEYALELIKKQEAAARELGKQRLDSGASAGSHSIGVRIRKRMSQEGWNQAAQVLGKDFGWATDGRMTGLFDLSIEQLKELQEKAPSFWAQLDGDVQNYLNSIIESEKAIEDMRKILQESVTQVSFDSFRDSFLDTLLDMNSDAKDFAEDFEKYLQKSMLNSLLKEKFDEQIRALYNSFSKYGEDNINEAEYAALQKQKDDLVKDMIKERDKMKDLFDWTSDSDTSQSSSRGGFETITQDQAGSIDGRLTGIHETDLNILSILTLIQLDYSKLKEYGLITADGVLEIKQTLMYCMDYLANIAKSNNELYQIREDIAYLRKNGIKIN